MTPSEFLFFIGFFFVIQADLSALRGIHGWSYIERALGIACMLAAIISPFSL